MAQKLSDMELVPLGNESLLIICHSMRNYIKSVLPSLARQDH